MTPHAMPRRLYRVAGQRGHDDAGSPLWRSKFYVQRPAAERRAQWLEGDGWTVTTESVLVVPEVEPIDPTEWPRLLRAIARALPKIGPRQRRNIIESVSSALADAARRSGIEAR